MLVQGVAEEPQDIVDKRTGLGVGGMLRRIGLTGLCFSRDRSFVVSNDELLRWLLCMQRCVLRVQGCLCVPCWVNSCTSAPSHGKA